jgi:hypothetical protein
MANSHSTEPEYNTAAAFNMVNSHSTEPEYSTAAAFHMANSHSTEPEYSTAAALDTVNSQSTDFNMSKPQSKDPEYSTASTFETAPRPKDPEYSIAICNLADRMSADAESQEIGNDSVDFDEPIATRIASAISSRDTTAFATMYEVASAPCDGVYHVAAVYDQEKIAVAQTFTRKRQSPRRALRSPKNRSTNPTTQVISPRIACVHPASAIDQLLGAQPLSLSTLLMKDANRRFVKDNLHICRVLPPLSFFFF